MNISFAYLANLIFPFFSLLATFDTRLILRLIYMKFKIFHMEIHIKVPENTHSGQFKNCSGEGVN